MEREHPEFREKREQCETSKDVFDYIMAILKEDEIQMPPPEPPMVLPVQSPVKREKPIKKKAKKRANGGGHIHYSSSSSSSSEEEEEAEPQVEEKPLDADGNEVISTSNDVWKTSVEVEHTENENMDDFINQLFLYYVCITSTFRSKDFLDYDHFRTFSQNRNYIPTRMNISDLKLSRSFEQIATVEREVYTLLSVLSEID